jgi:hypothetical protein
MECASTVLRIGETAKVIVLEDLVARTLTRPPPSGTINSVVPLAVCLLVERGESLKQILVD